MSVNLRDRLYSDTGGIVQNATVQAILVTGGGTDAGTSSVVQATTTTDVNGVWKFTGLPDPGAGNWYDVKITNGNQIRWRYGNIQSVIASLQLQSTVWASPHFTSPVVDSGGLTVTAGGLTVTAGSVSLPANTVAGAALSLGQLYNAIGGTVLLNNTATYFTGPQVAQGTSGTWYASGHVTFYDGTGPATFYVVLWDGATNIASTVVNTSGANVHGSAHLSGIITNPSGNIRISVKDITTANGAISQNDSTNQKDSVLTAFRIG